MTQPARSPGDPLYRSLSPDDLPDPRTSLSLLALAQGGDQSALEELISRYQERLRRIVRIQLRGSDLRRRYDSMDIVQSTFRAALPKLGDLRPRSAAGLLQWLATIATNHIRDVHDREHARKRDTAREVPMKQDLDSSADQPQLVAPATPPDEQAFMSEVRELLDDEVSRLPEDQRRVVTLRDYCGEDWDRVASELGRDSVHAARQLHQRAWISLRQALGPKLGRGTEELDQR